MSSLFDELSAFIQKKMRMSHIYQPVMLMKLLENKGSASVRDIAKAILLHDQSQVDYYSHITKTMPGRVLGKNHKLIDKQEEQYALIGFDQLSESEARELYSLCQQRLSSYIDKRGQNIWEHRTKSSGYISGTLRYEILKAAKFRCELCGISAEHKALEVDHITPRNNGGSDDLTNLQCLCYSCNAMKRDRDDTDFRGVANSYRQREKGCLFCEIPGERIIRENELAYVIHDAFPVTVQHSLIIPKRHVASYFDLYKPELNACNRLLQEAKEQVLKEDAFVTGFNVGMNSGEDAGQTIFHCHIHLIPRRNGDTNKPKGGVRGVIPGMQSY